MQPRRVGGEEGRHELALSLEAGGVEIAQQAEVEQAEPPVRTQDAVVRVRVARDDALPPGQLEEEAERDLPDAIALPVAEALDRLGRQSGDVLRHQHATR